VLNTQPNFSGLLLGSDGQNVDPKQKFGVIELEKVRILKKPILESEPVCRLEIFARIVFVPVLNRDRATIELAH
jgi:hypothetical protein